MAVEFKVSQAVRVIERRSWLWVGGVAVAAVAFAATGGQAQKGYKVLLAYDLEGVTAAENAGEYNTSNPKYADVQASLTEDVNAAIRGLQKAGALEIVLTDCHASGNTSGPDYLMEKLPAGVRFEMRDRPYDPYVDVADKTFDALVMVGMHARSGGTGFSPHTYFGMVRWNYNGLEMSETSEVALAAARFGVPLVLVTGDDQHRAEVAEFSNAEYVAVKKSISAQKAEAFPRSQVSGEIEAAAERALKQLEQKTVYKFPAKGVSLFKFPLAEYTAIASNYPNVEVVDDRTLRLTTVAYIDGLLAYRSISNFMRYSTADTLIKTVQTLPNGDEMIRAARAKLPPRSYEATSKTLKVDNKLDKWGYQ